MKRQDRGCCPPAQVSYRGIDGAHTDAESTRGLQQLRGLTLIDGLQPSPQPSAVSDQPISATALVRPSPWQTLSHACATLRTGPSLTAELRVCRDHVGRGRFGSLRSPSW